MMHKAQEDNTSCMQDGEEKRQATVKTAQVERMLILVALILSSHLETGSFV